MAFQLKRAYDDVESDDGYRVLVDRLWPRGVSKQKLQLDAWLREIAPSDALRKWYDHTPGKFDEFCRRYADELESRQDLVDELVAKERDQTVTLIYSARNREYNNAVALKAYLENRTDTQ